MGGLSRDDSRGRGAVSLSTVGRKRFLAHRDFLPFAFAEVMQCLDGMIFEGRVSASYK
jgi:hypothetical protein